MAVVICKGEDVLMFAGLIDLLKKLSIPHYIVDISEEKGWFRKGSMYLSLDYGRPDLSIEFKPSDVGGMRRRLGEFLEGNDVRVVVVHGASLGALLAASEASSRAIPVVNVDAGLRGCRDAKLRSAADHLANYNVTSLPSALRNLLSEGFSQSSVKLVGHPATDAIRRLSSELGKSTILGELGLEEGGYVAGIIHDPSSIAYVGGIAEKAPEETPLVLSLSKDVEADLTREGKYVDYQMDYNVMFVEQLDIVDAVALIRGSRLVITDVDYACVAAAMLRKPAVYVGDAYPRPELISGGWVKTIDSVGGSLEAWSVERAASSVLGRGLVSEAIMDVLSEALRSTKRPSPPEMPRDVAEEYKGWVG